MSHDSILWGFFHTLVLERLDPGYVLIVTRLDRFVRATQDLLSDRLCQ
jgi:hypothetical protein